MSEQAKAPAPGAADGATPSANTDEIKNLKSEFNRKLDNLNTQLKQQNEALVAQLQSLVVPKKQEATSDEDDIGDLVYKNPTAFAKRIKEEAKRDIQAQLSARDEENNKRNDIVQKLYADFPELAIADHPLTVSALEKYKEISKDSGATPASYRAAVYEAAMDHGVQPKKKRGDSDDFTGFSGKGDSRPAKKKDEAISPQTAELARLMGVDPEKVAARAKKRSNYGKWE